MTKERFQLLFVAAGFAGCSLRCFHFLRDPSMWHDEAAAVLNVLKHTELAGPLYLSSTSPPLFLGLQRLVVAAFGDGTHALRLSSLIFSCGGLLLFMKIARRLLPPWPAVATILLVAFSDRLIWHAAEARHYSSDFLWATVLLYLLLKTGEWSLISQAVLFSTVIPCVIFGSYPGIFLTAGVLAASFSGRDKTWGGFLVLCAPGIIAAIAFLLFYITVVRWQRNPLIVEAWTKAFPDLQRPWLLPWWFIRSCVGLGDYGARPLGGLLVFPAVVGGISWWRQGRRGLVLFATAPILLAAAAALIKAYPFTGARTMVFSAPGLTLLAGAGAYSLWRWAAHSRRWRIVATSWIALPAAASIGLCAGRVLAPWPRPNVAAAAAFVLQERNEREVVIGNDWTHEYYFRGLGALFVPMSGVAGELPRSYWMMVTAADPRERARLAALAKGRVAHLQDFEGTTVLRLVQEGSVP